MRLFCFLAVSCAFLAAVAAVAEQHEGGLMAEVEAFGDAIEKAMLAEDVETMLAMYADDAISLPNYGPRMDGVEAFRQHHEQMSGMGMKILSFSSDPSDVWSCGDQVIEIGTFEIELEMPGAPGPIDDHGKYMTVYVRDADGNLKIKAETWNTDVNPMEMMGGPGHDHGDEESDSESDSGDEHDHAR